jgi:hypothetical protein
MVMRERFSESDRRKLLDSLKEADGRRGPPERGDVVALVAKLREALGSSDLSDSQRAEFAGTLKILEREYEFILGEALPGPGPGGSFTREERAALLAALDGGRSASAPAPAHPASRGLGWWCVRCGKDGGDGRCEGQPLRNGTPVWYRHLGPDGGRPPLGELRDVPSKVGQFKRRVEYTMPDWCICPRCKAPKWLVNLACSRHGD